MPATISGVQSSDALLAMFDNAPLNRRYWTSFGLLAVLTALDFFDFFLIAFILSKIGPEWKLTYGQSGLILYGGGVGAILGALVWGSLSDVLGRKLQIVTGTLICAVSAGMIGLLPTGAWIALATLRILVGFGLAAAATPCLTIIVEQTPTRWRTGMTSFFVVFASAGTLLASLTSAVLFQWLGWRGLAMLGIIPAAFGLLVWVMVPESVRWLTAKGRFAEARAGVATHLGLPLSAVPLPTVPPTAAGYFIYVASCGVSGKILLSLIAPSTGRRTIGVAFGLLAAVFLVAAGIYHGAMIGGFPAMIVLIAASAFFAEGGFSNLAPYTVEQYGVALGSRSSGLGQAANGVGKILGPLALALIAGSSNLVSPQATADAVLPAFLFLAGGMLAVALAFAFLGVETHGVEIGDLATGQASRPTRIALGTD